MKSSNRIYSFWSLLFLCFYVTSSFGQVGGQEKIFGYKDPKVRNPKGSFVLQVYVENGDNDHDLLTSPVADFRGIDEKEIRIGLGSLKLDPKSNQEVEVQFDLSKLKYPKHLLTLKRGGIKKIRQGRRPQFIKFEPKIDGNVKFELHYQYKNGDDKGADMVIPVEFAIKNSGAVIQTTSEPIVEEKKEKPKSKPKVATSKNREQDDWNAIDEKGTLKAYRRYLESYPDGKYVTKAKEKITALREKAPVGFNISGKYTVTFENTKGIQKSSITSLSGDTTGIADIVLTNLGANELGDEQIQIKLPSGKHKFNFNFTDDWGKTVSFELDSEVEEFLATLKSQEKDKVLLNLSGGVPPYSYEVHDNKGELMGRGDVKKVEGEYLIPYSEVSPQLKGAYQITLLDKRKSFSIDLDDLEINYGESAFARNKNIFIGAGITLLLILLGVVFNNKRKKREEAEAELKRAEAKNKKSVVTPTAPTVSTPKTAVPAVQSTMNKKKLSVKKKPRKTVAIPPTSVSRSNSTNRNVKIRKRSEGAISGKGQLDNAAFQQLVSLGAKYIPINMNRIWEDTSISHVFIKQQAIANIDHFILTTNQIAKEETEDSPPEIGGFLLGSYSLFGDQYQVSIDEFVSITPEDNDVYTIEFGTQAWSKLDDIIMKSGNNKDLIGWFHTHPGHGLFLSQPDLKIHNGFFTKPHKLAMEIDPLTHEDFDTAFFTRKPNGEMNNAKDRLTKQWDYWSSIKAKTQKV